MVAVTMSFEGITDREAENLKKALRRRDPTAIDLLIDRYQYRLMRYLLSLAESRSSAEDLFQETWIRVLEHGDQYDGRSKFEPWLFRIARNLVIDRLRRRKPILSIEGLEESQGFEPPGGSVATEHSSQLDHVERLETRENVAAALDQLPVTYREVLALRFQEELSLEEIAGLVGAPLSTVKSRLYRGMEMLREKLEGLKP
jgi:RNA polymerase sigma-70 factor (ECF subfamily)